MPDNPFAIEVIVAGGYARIAEHYPDEVAAASDAARKLRADAHQAVAPATEPTVTYRIGERTVAS